MIPARLIAHRAGGKRTMISIMIPEARMKEDKIEDLILEMAAATLEKTLGKDNDIILIELLERKK